MNAFGPILLALAAGAAQAQEPYAGNGYLLSCGEEGCFINSAGFNLFAPEGQAPLDVLRDLPMMTAVQVEGTLSEMGDSSATITLTSAAPIVDDLYEGNLQFMQGAWRPEGEETPFHITIAGMDWIEVLGEGDEVYFMMSVGEYCGDGTFPGNGMVISLYRYGDDPGDDACWRLEYVDEATLELRDFKGDQGAVTFSRMTE
jgi:hypothetical protein